MQTVCRTCLASDVRLLPLKSVPQADIFEKLTTIPFNVDGRPRVICNDCFWKLQRCRDFCDMANRSERIFEELIARGIETTPQNITKLNQQMHQPKLLSSVPTTAKDTHSQPWSTSEIVTIEFVKEEPVWETEDEKSVKENELTDNQDGISVNEDEISVKEDTKPVKDIISVKEDTKPVKDIISVNIERLEPVAHTKPYTCDICDKRFSWKTYLINHMRIHREKLFACNECDKNFVDNYRLVAHMRVHDEENPYACTVCDKGFTQNSSLERHMRIHTGEKPYRCFQCRERFNQKSSLISHERVHSGEKPYPCQSCGIHFGKKCTLVRHMRVHTGEKPYVCNNNKCNKKYTRKTAMERHMRKCSKM